MPGVSTSAANMGDEIQDAMDIASAGVKSIWLEGLGWVAGIFGNEFAGDVRGAMTVVVGDVEYGVKSAMAWIAKLWTKITATTSRLGSAYGAYAGTLTQGGIDLIKGDGGVWRKVKGIPGLFGQALGAAREDWGSTRDEYSETLSQADRLYEGRIKGFENKLAKAKAAAKSLKLHYEGATKPTITVTHRTDTGDLSNRGSEQRKPTISNALVMGGTNEAIKMAILGPQQEAIKIARQQQRTLERIEDNTGKTAKSEQAS